MYVHIYRTEHAHTVIIEIVSMVTFNAFGVSVPATNKCPHTSYKEKDMLLWRHE